ncbi:MAG: tRNA pseudouridine(55) synthase TruB [Clostridia bacterium]|nr:tRNA pseudouridine(55) synthase TruB [Clostridia bacterium]
MTGIINLYKEAGMTSHSCVAAVRKILHTKKVGHAGTLDPEATGVLPVLVGNATRCSDFFLKAGKEYEAVARFGFVSDTQDVWGKVSPAEGAETAQGLTPEKIAETLKTFEGEIFQVPPMYSALKKDGVPLYKLARRGIDAGIEARKVTVYTAELEGVEGLGDGNGFPKAKIRISCGRGTYIRTIIHDLGEELGCGAVMSSLKRTAYGNFRAENAVTLAELAEAAAGNRLETILEPIDTLFAGRPRAELSEKEFFAYMQGKSLVLDPARFLIPDGAGPAEEHSLFADGFEREEDVPLTRNGRVFATCTLVPADSDGKDGFVKTVHGRFFGVED